MRGRRLAVVIVVAEFAAAIVACSADPDSTCTGSPRPVGTFTLQGPVQHDGDGGVVCDAYCPAPANLCGLVVGGQAVACGYDPCK